MKLFALAGNRLSSVLPRPSSLKATMRLAGAALLVVALQAWAFHQGVAAREAKARDHLDRLQQEIADRRLIDGALQALRDYRQAAGSEDRKRRALALRDIVLENFSREPRPTVDRFVRAAGEFEAETTVEQEALDTLHERVDRLQDVYDDHYTPLVNASADPAWYFRPAALLEPGRRDVTAALRFNRALYLVLTGEHEAADAVLGELLEDALSDRFRSRILYAQARLRYEVYRLGADAGYFGEALELTRHSVTAGPGHVQARLFLDYLLGIPRAAREADIAPVRGPGSGEGEAKRGTIVTDSDEF